MILTNDAGHGLFSRIYEAVFYLLLDLLRISGFGVKCDNQLLNCGMSDEVRVGRCFRFSITAPRAALTSSEIARCNAKRTKIRQSQSRVKKLVGQKIVYRESMSNFQ